MARLMKNWKEASSLILATRKTAIPRLKGSEQSGKVKGETGPTQYKPCDFNILTMQRSNSSSFFPNAVVFPGGVTDAHDFSPRWMDVFSKSGFTAASLESLKTLGKRLPMYKPESHSFVSHVADEHIQSEIGYRINAIRETFEETGVLLARSNSNLERTNSTASVSTVIAEDALMTWRNRVSGDASQFMNLCLEFDLCPDIFSLKEWCNWLTPVIREQALMEQYKMNKRYDTIFYIAFTEVEPKSSNDNNEAQSIRWDSHDNLLRKFYSSDLLLGPPQVHEISRLAQFSNFENLQKYAYERANKGLERWMAVRFKMSDGILAVASGDDLYPEDTNFHNGVMISLDGTMSEHRKRTKNCNRMEIYNMNDVRCYCNIDLLYDQIPPVEFGS